MWCAETKGLVQLVRPAPHPPRLEPEDRWNSLDQLISRLPTTNWVIDLEQEHLLTSEALATLVGTLRKVQNAGGRMAFIHAQPGVANVLRSMRLTRLIPLFETADLAIQELSVRRATEAG